MTSRPSQPPIMPILVGMAACTPLVLFLLALAFAVVAAVLIAASSARADSWTGIISSPVGIVSAIPYMPTFDGTIGSISVVYGSGVSYLPDPAKTPGEVGSTNQADVCGKVNGKTYEKRNRGWLTDARKDAITRIYGQVPGQDGDNELDHRIPAALGGKSSALNVWWQPGRGHGTVWDFHVKDRLDTWAWRQVCVLHKTPLAEAQAWFMEPDWTKVYCRLIGGVPCAP